MKVLFQGIGILFSATPHNSFYNAVSGRLYRGFAPQNTTYPYAIYHLDSIVPDFTFSSTFEEILILFNLFSNEFSTSEITDMYEYLNDLFDDSTISITGYTRVKFERGFSSLNRDIEESVWQYDVQYRVILRKS